MAIAGEMGTQAYNKLIQSAVGLSNKNKEAALALQFVKNEIIRIQEVGGAIDIGELLTKPFEDGTTAASQFGKSLSNTMNTVKGNIDNSLGKFVVSIPALTTDELSEYYLMLDQQRQTDLEKEKAAQEEKTRMAVVYKDAIIGIGQILTSTEKQTFGERLKNLGAFLVDVISKELIARKAVILLNLLEAAGTLNFAKIATASLALIGIQAAAQGAKALLGAKEGTGSLTSSGLAPGNPNEIAGYFHGKELVVEAPLAPMMLPMYQHLRKTGSMPDYMQKQDSGIHSEYHSIKKEQSQKSKIDMTHKFKDVKIMNDHIRIAVEKSQYADMARY